MPLTDYDRRAREALDLPEPDPAKGPALHLGAVKIGDANAALDATVARWLAVIRRRVAQEIAAKRRRDGLPPQTGRYDFLAFDEYLDACHRIAALRRDVERALGDPTPPRPKQAVRTFVGLYSRQHHTPDRRGYRHYLGRAAPPQFAALLRRELPVYLSEDDRLRHTYVVATTGAPSSSSSSSTATSRHPVTPP